MTRLAVIVPTRSRPHNLDVIEKAWWATGAFSVADLILAIDVDDMSYPNYQVWAQAHPHVKVAVLPEWKPLVPKLNEVALRAASDGAYKAVAFMGDDHVPVTTMWAHMLVQSHMIHPGSIWYGQDGFQDRKLASWWSMDSDLIVKLGKMVPAPVQHMYCDNSIMVLGDKSGRLHHDERILIEHRHPFAGKAEMDQQYQRVNRPQQYQTDGELFHQWLADGLAQDVSLVQSVGG
jgi:hypothetical protein